MKYRDVLLKKNSEKPFWREVTLTKSRGVCPSLFFFVASAPCFRSSFTISYFPWKTFFYGKYIIMCPNLGCCFMQGGEFPEVRYVDSCAMLHQQLSDLKHIYIYVLLCRIWYYFLPFHKAKQVRSAIIVCGTTCPILMCFPCYFHDLVVIDNVPHNVHMSRHCEEVPAHPG